MLLWLNQLVHDSELQGAWRFRLCSPLEPGRPGWHLALSRTCVLAQITNPMPTRQGVFFQHVGLLSSPGHLDPAEKVEDAHPKLWCVLNEGKVIVFDASSWTIHQHCFRVGTSKLVS